jgi:hypothetical protein
MFGADLSATRVQAARRNRLIFSRQAIANRSNVRTTFLKQNLMVSAGCEPTSASFIGDLYARSVLPGDGTLTRQESRTRQVKEIADGFQLKPRRRLSQTG